MWEAVLGMIMLLAVVFVFMGAAAFAIDLARDLLYGLSGGRSTKSGTRSGRCARTCTKPSGIRGTMGGNSPSGRGRIAA